LSLQDSLPERRNLTLVALAFIAFFYGGGQLTENEVRLIIINVSFTKPTVLSLMAWLSFIWFIWRYWLVTKGGFIPKFKDELINVAKNKFTYRYVSARTPYKFQDFIGLSPPPGTVNYAWNGNFTLKKMILQATIKHYSLYNSNNEQFKLHLKNNPQPDFIVRFNDVLGIIYIVYAFIKTIISRDSFSTYVSPYILTLIAILGAVI
jgi:hypothetical protein